MPQNGGKKGWITLPLLEPGPDTESPHFAMMAGTPYRPSLRSRAPCYTYHVRAVNSPSSVSQVKGPGWMAIAETVGNKRSTSHFEQVERGFTRSRTGWWLRCELPADMKPSRTITRGEGEVIVNAQMCR